MKLARTTYKSFPEAGYTVIKNSEILFTFDHGPLGMEPLYNHGHADALSITISIKGNSMIVDPGTFGYNGPSELREYFKGTRAHSTVTIDNEDQAIQETKFIWRCPYTAELLSASRKDDGLVLTGTHNGYERLKDPVKHIRKVFFSGEGFFLIEDSFSGKGMHDFELNYHLHPEAATTEREDGWWLIERDSAKLYMRLLGGAGLNYAAGVEKPFFGWCSPSYGVRLKSGVLSRSERGYARDVRFETAICINKPMHLKELLEKRSSL